MITAPSRRYPPPYRQTLLTAHYISESADTDGDGIKDWYEYRMFGSLNIGPTDDPDGDGFDNKRESELGQDPLIVDNVEWGHIPQVIHRVCLCGYIDGAGHNQE